MRDETGKKSNDQREGTSKTQERSSQTNRSKRSSATKQSGNRRCVPVGIARSVYMDFIQRFAVDTLKIRSQICACILAGLSLFFAQNLAVAQKFSSGRDLPTRTASNSDSVVKNNRSFELNTTPKENSPPHPSVARIIVFEKKADSFGSGSYVQSFGNYGIVITNRHVVKEAVGLIQVHFPNGFTSYAAVLDSDEKWDLATLLISKPQNTPILKISRTTPQPNDSLWIAGYGSGKYRIAAGRCTNYIQSPNFEFVDVSVDARQGDSGGPIFDRNGELAGVLFGSDSSNTAGSYCGRVRLFLEQSNKKLSKIPEKPEQLFALIEPGAPKHTLAEGGKIFRNQILGITSEITSDVAVATKTAKPAANGPQIGAKLVSTGETAKSTKPTKPTEAATEPKPPVSPPSGVKIVSGNPNPTERRPRSVNPSQVVATKAENAAPSPLVNRTKPAAQISAEHIVSPRIALQSPPMLDQMETTGFKQSESAPQFGSEYTEVSEAGESESSLLAAPRSFGDAVKLVAIIIVVFFVVFHLVKLMSIIEENEEK